MRVGTRAALGTALATIALACGASLSATDVVDGGADASADATSCRSNDDCSSNQFCDAPGRCSGDGVCRDVPKGCPGLAMPVCGCNGAWDSNDCLLHYQEHTGVAYGGACRNTTLRSCRASSDCAPDEICGTDALTCDAGADCAGHCLTATFASDGPFECYVGASCGGPTSTCVRAACRDAGDFSCAFCVFTSALGCDASADCPIGQLCLPNAACVGSCSASCVVP